MKFPRIKKVLDVAIFVLTIFMVLYGLLKGFNLVELVTNLTYFSALLAKMIIDLWEDRSEKWKKYFPPAS